MAPSFTFHVLGGIWIQPSSVLPSSNGVATIDDATGAVASCAATRAEAKSSETPRHAVLSATNLGIISLRRLKRLQRQLRGVLTLKRPVQSADGASTPRALSPSTFPHPASPAAMHSRDSWNRCTAGSAPARKSAR